MLRDLSPTYSYKQSIELLTNLTTREDFALLQDTINDDLRNYTALEYLSLRKKIQDLDSALWNKEFKKTMEDIKKIPPRKFTQAELDEQMRLFNQEFVKNARKKK